MTLKSPEMVLRAALVADQTVNGLLGSRIYPLLAPATATLPLVTWQRTGIAREQSLKAPIGVPTVTIEYVIYAATYEQARQLADAMRKVLDGYSGQADNTQVRNASLVNESDGFVTLEGADLPPVYSVTQSYDVAWQEI
jgi:hypothetical protein